MDDSIESIVRWYQEGVSVNQIGRRLGVKHQAIKSRLEEQGIEVRKSSKHTKEIPTNRKDVWEFKEKILFLYKEGKTLNEIATIYGCKGGVIKKILIRHNIPIRSKKDNVRYQKTECNNF